MGNKQSSIDYATLEKLCQTTTFTKNEISLWYKEFMRDNPTGKITKAECYNTYNYIFPSSSQYIEDSYDNDTTSQISEQEYKTKMFNIIMNVFDENGDNEINFEEFISGIALVSGSCFLIDKFKLAFKILDEDKKGYLDFNEFKKFVKAVDSLHDSFLVDNRHFNFDPPFLNEHPELQELARRPENLREKLSDNQMGQKGESKGSFGSLDTENSYRKANNHANNPNTNNWSNIKPSESSYLSIDTTNSVFLSKPHLDFRNIKSDYHNSTYFYSRCRNLFDNCSSSVADSGIRGVLLDQLLDYALITEDSSFKLAKERFGEQDVRDYQKEENRGAKPTTTFTTTTTTTTDYYMQPNTMHRTENINSKNTKSLMNNSEMGHLV